MSDESKVDRRDFLKAGVAGAAAVALGSGTAEAEPAYDRDAHNWGYMVDLTACIGCGACVRACSAENDVPDNFFRTWVERYTFTRDGKVHVDSPDGARNGFKSDPEGVDPETVTKSFFVPKLCNHCVQSPCVQVCPVGASYETKDGVVLVDRNHCIGCGYCIQACPFGCRFLNPKGYADKCTLCYHRITKGLPPACVEACPVGARQAGNMKDPNSPIRKLLDTSRFGVLKPDLGTHPKVYYVGLDAEVI
ncbi:MAG: ferredoxin [Myxococcales bacterium]